jgi:N-acetylmuramoyl-L-alanine amidase
VAAGRPAAAIWGELGRVSAHYGIGTHGAIHQYVGESDTAYHAGRSFEPVWTLLKPGTNPNLYTIGIEHEGTAESLWPDAMYTSSARLIAAVCNRWCIPIDRAHIVGHREIYARKTCPGNAVDLEHLVGLAHGAALGPDPYNFVRRSGRARARVRLNVRRGAPTVLAPIVRTVPAAALLRYAGWTSNGLAVHGNAHWYRDLDGNYFWAGGTERPTPGVAPAGGSRP